MDIVIVILVLLVVIALLIGVGYYFVKETGQAHLRLWLTSPVYLREALKSWTGRGSDDSAARGIDATETAPLPGVPAGSAPAIPVAAASASSPYQLVVDDTLIRDLREELQGELRRAAGQTREFDARLTRIESNVVDAPRASEAFQRALADRDAAHDADLSTLRRDIEAVQRTSGAYGERRGEALAELYSHLAKVESALAGVVHPMQLPGEPLTLPESFFPETLVWDNWNDVGECAYAFGNVFNQNRLVLDSDTADEMERFMATLREALTGAVYPNVRAQNPSQSQLAQMRNGLKTIVASLPVVRRRLERAYRGDDTRT